MATRPPFPAGWSSIPMTLRNLSLSNTLPVGQSFLWHRQPLNSSEPPLEEYSRALDGPPRVVCLRQTPSHLFYTAVHASEEAATLDRERGTTRDWLHDYFHLLKYPDLEAMYADWQKRDPALFGKVDVEGPALGVRVLRQDPWECLVSFITSTNNHIPRITSLLHRMSSSFSQPVLTLEHAAGLEPVTYYLFPRPHEIPSLALEPRLRQLGFGYRAPFIESSLETLREKFGNDPGDIEAGLSQWREADTEIAREQLVQLKGVGRKVADCVLLMCLDKPSIIPIDTHVAAIASRHPSFPSRLKNKPMSKDVYKETQDFLLDKWGTMGGWCQAVMFAADLPQPKTTVKKAKAEKVKGDATGDAATGDATGAILGSKRVRPVEETVHLKRTRSATRLTSRKLAAETEVKEDLIGRLIEVKVEVDKDKLIEVKKENSGL